jgi:hypothetical protein
LRRADQDVDAARLHVDPDRAGGNAIQYKHAADGMHSVGHCAQISVRQHHSGCGFDMRCKDQIRLVFPDRSDHVFDRRRCIGSLSSLFDRTRLQHDRFRRNAAHVENLRPAETEPAIADDQTLPVRCELPGNGFHAESAAARDDNGRLRVVDFFQ